MSIASVSHTYVFGLSSTTGRDNVYYVDESTIIYPAGCNVVVTDIDQRSQKFVPCSDKAEAISALTVSSDRHLFAVAEKSSKPAIMIYDLHSFRKRRTLSPTSEGSGLAKEFTCLAFSSDARYLVAQLSAPEWILHYYAWEKGKLLATMNLQSMVSGPLSSVNPTLRYGHGSGTPGGMVTGYSNAGSNIHGVGGNGINGGANAHGGHINGGIEQIGICPTDGCQVSVIGGNYFRIYRYAEGGMKLSSEIRMPQTFLCHCWLPNERVALGTVEGKIIVTAAGEIIQELLFVGGVSSPHPATSNTSQHAQQSQPSPPSVHSMINMARGLVVGGRHNQVEVFERYVDSNTKQDMFRSMWKLGLPDEGSLVRCMALSGSEGSLLVELETNQLLRIALAWSELMKGDEVKFEPVSQPYHHGAITGMDICCRKPLLVTCSADKSIRIWNYQTGSCELSKYFPEEAYSVSLHPSGLYVLVGFTDKLRLLNVLIDDFRLFKEFSIRGCRECCFSNGGHIFAAVHGNMIQLYSTWTFDYIGNFKGHNGKVRSLHWTPDDSVLVSAGSDGAVYTWIVRDFKRENEHILKSCSYTSAICTPNGKSVYAVGSDKILKEITESTVSSQMETSVVLTQLAISRSGRMMFAGSSTGQIRALKYPFSAEVDDFQEHQAHSASITKFRISYDDQFLFSASEDGCIYMFKISDKDDRTMKRDRNHAFADEILITKSDLEEKTVLMSELQRSLEELKLEHEYQLRLKDMNFNEQLKEITEKYSQEIEALKISTSVLRTEKDKEEVKHEEEHQNVKTRHMNELHEIEAKYNQQLMEEYEKFQKLQTDATHKSAEISKLQEERQQQIAENEEMARQNDDDIDAEINLVGSRYEKKLRAEREEGARLKGENGIMRKKFNTLNKDIDDNKAEITRMKEDEKKLRSVIAMLEKEIATFKKDMAERDELIQDKERRVYDLKKKNQELEKFKFVLDFRIKELKQQVEPRESEISDMTKQIKDINLELELLNKQKALFEEEIRNFKVRLEATKNDQMKEHRKFQEVTHYIKVFKNDLQDAIQYIQEPAILKKCAENLNKKYCHGIENLSHSGIEPDVKREYHRQHEVLKDQITELRMMGEQNLNLYRADN
ncbi:Cilia- and flagella-associated protein 57, partial [Blyttiomyces sp. JEL0837]